MPNPLSFFFKWLGRKPRKTEDEAFASIIENARNVTVEQVRSDRLRRIELLKWHRSERAGQIAKAQRQHKKFSHMGARLKAMTEEQMKLERLVFDAGLDAMFERASK